LRDSILKPVAGSGFLVFVPVDTNGFGRVLLITNKHVLPKPTESKTITVKIPYKLENSFTFIQFTVEIFNKSNILNHNIRFHGDKNTDVAAIDITDIVNLRKLSLNPIHSSFLLKKSEYQTHNIGLGNEIFIIGYPSSIYDEQTASPIVRQGTIASYPYHDFYFNKSLLEKDSTLPNPLKGFLIDGSIFGGSSGSMVILKTSWEMTDPKRFAFVKEVNYILGIISRNISIKNQSLDIGIVFSSDNILEVINEFK
jgi:hypothetical protein